MRTVAALISLSLFAPAAFAAPRDARPPAAPAAQPSATPAAPVEAKPATPAVNLAPINLTETPERCHPIAKRAAGANLLQALSARISLASCIADAKFSDLKLIDGQASITEMDEVALPSFAMLDEVVAAATDPVTKVMATHAKAQLLHVMINRMTQTVTTSAATTPEAHALRETRRQIMQELLVPWRDRTREVYLAVDEIAKANPTIVKNPVAVAAIRDSREQLQRTVAATAAPAPKDELEAPEATEPATTN
jgi:hypothetical protein